VHDTATVKSSVTQSAATAALDAVAHVAAEAIGVQPGYA